MNLTKEKINERLEDYLGDFSEYEGAGILSGGDYLPDVSKENIKLLQEQLQTIGDLNNVGDMDAPTVNKIEFVFKELLKRNDTIVDEFTVQHESGLSGMVEHSLKHFANDRLYFVVASGGTYESPTMKFRVVDLKSIFE